MTKPADSKQAIPSPEDRVRALCDWLKFEARDRTNEAKGRRSTADVMRKATEEQLCAAKRTAERMHGHKLPNVSTDRKSAKLSADMDDRIATKLEAQAQQLSAWASLVEELIPFCDSPCGHTSQYAYSEDGGKNIVCLICEREELKGQAVSASPQPTCPKCGSEVTWWITAKDQMPVVRCRSEQCDEIFRIKELSDFAQFFADLLRKRKDYHAEYVEAVEAADKVQGELDRMREALRRLRNNAMQGKVTSALIDEVDVFLFPALTPEPATKAEVPQK